MLTFHNGDVVNNTTYNLVFPSCQLTNLPKTERRRRSMESIQDYWKDIDH